MIYEGIDVITEFMRTVLTAMKYNFVLQPDNMFLILPKIKLKEDIYLFDKFIENPK